ncbi:MAG: carbamoyltransferase HypF [Coriobacteriia bacterium]
MRAARIHVTGVVQGVGFRPFVYSLAEETGITGWVLNSSEGVFAHAEGDPASVAAFIEGLSAKAPPMAVVQSVQAVDVAPEGFDDFQIRESERKEGERTLISPDIATCEACEREMWDASDRRHRYPFINCTNCGPRFTIIEDIPYDRPMTTMRDFPMCEECAREYADPADRRFHAQPNACHVCGPRLYLNPSEEWEWSPEVEVVPRPHRDRDSERARTDAIIAAAARVLAEGRILAVKGLGGFQLACDATDEEAVSRLRRRKNRWGKPLAIMVKDLEAVRTLCEVGEQEEALLAGTVRPIVLLRRKGCPATDVAPSVADPLPDLGVMLPYTPVHHLLVEAAGKPLVMTSGNLSEEPIAMDNAEALERLRDIADAFLIHDRGIYSRYDDSVTRVRAGHFEMIRRARGYAPFPLVAPFESPKDILATGPEQKNTFCLLSGSQAFVSQHIGDMENVETLEHFEKTLELYERMFRITPEVVAYDLHPEYLSTKFAMELDLPKTGVQHHHAHIVSVMAEHGISDPVVGFAFDGTGYGTDGTIWGGEVLVCEWGRFERWGHLTTVPLAGGAAAIKRPARMALATLLALDESLLDHPGAAPWRQRLAQDEEPLVRRMIERGLNTLPTSSMGRLFDTVAALVGVRDDARYEGQAAIELEATADTHAEGSYAFALAEDDVFRLDPAPVIAAVLDDLAAGVPTGTLSMRFHRAVAQIIVRCAQRACADVGTKYAALAGGVFMNRIVTTLAEEGLARAGLTPLLHKDLPTNDGGISFGQAVVAFSRLDGL